MKHRIENKHLISYNLNNKYTEQRKSISCCKKEGSSNTERQVNHLVMPITPNEQIIISILVRLTRKHLSINQAVHLFEVALAKPFIWLRMCK